MLIQVGAQLAKLHGNALSVVKLAGLFGRSVTDKAVSKGQVPFANVSRLWVEMVFGGGASSMPRNMRLLYRWKQVVEHEQRQLTPWRREDNAYLICRSRCLYVPHLTSARRAECILHSCSDDAGSLAHGMGGVGREADGFRGRGLAPLRRL